MQGLDRAWIPGVAVFPTLILNFAVSFSPDA